MTREINREVAEKVMEFTKHCEHSWLNPNDGEVWFFDEFNPAERIEHSIMCLEKYRKDHPKQLIQLRFWPDNTVTCTIYPTTLRQSYLADEESDTAPMAICLAALKAKEGKG